MKGLVKFNKGVGSLELRDVPEGDLKPSQVRIHVEVAGICGSDWHIYQDEIAIPMRLPVVIGHEFSGAVSEVGEQVHNIKVGDRVTSETAFSVCGECYPCRAGTPHLCDNKQIIGYWVNGAFAEYCVVPVQNVHILPDNVDFFSGALAEPLACVVHGIAEVAKVEPDQRVLITGPGPIGLLALQVVHARGASAIICGLSQDKGRLAIAAALGAKAVIDVQAEDPIAVIEELTGAVGVDTSLECSGAAPALDLCLRATKKRGTVCEIGLYGHRIDADFDVITYRELQVVGSLSSTRFSWKEALALLAGGNINRESMISDVLPLSEWKQAFEKYRQKKGLKIVLIP